MLIGWILLPLQSRLHDSLKVTADTHGSDDSVVVGAAVVVGAVSVAADDVVVVGVMDVVVEEVAVVGLFSSGFSVAVVVVMLDVIVD